MTISIANVQSTLPDIRTLNNNDANYLFLEDTFFYSGSLLSIATNGGGGASSITNLSSNNGMELCNLLTLTPASATANTLAARSGIGRHLVLGKWKAECIFRIYIPQLAQIAEINNAYYYLGWTASPSIGAPAAAGDTASVLFVYDSLGVGIRVANNGAASTTRPTTPLFLSKDTVHTIHIKVSKLNPIAELYINGNFVVKATTTNFPTYNTFARSMNLFAQAGRVAADAVNLIPALSIDKVSVLLNKNESIGEFTF